MKDEVKKGMLLVTHGFPFGDSERGFLNTEFTELADNFSMYVLALGGGKDIKYPIVDIGHKNIKQYDHWEKNFFLKISGLFRRDVWKDIKLARDDRGGLLFLRRARNIISCSSTAELIQKEMEKILRKNKIDIIYTYWGTAEVVAALRLKEKHKNIKVITRFHGYDLYSERLNTNWQPFQQSKADCCDGIFFVCEAGKEYFIRKWGAAKTNKVSYLGTPHMHRIDACMSDEMILVSCSNLIELKRVELIIQAIGSLPDDIKIYWHHIGDGTEGIKLRKIAEQAFSSKTNIKWKFWGQIPNEKIEKIYHDIAPDLFITTSSSEGLPVSVQEAFAMGIPAIGTVVGGMSELIIDGKTGFLLNSDPDIKNIAGAIEKFYHMPRVEKQKMGNMARQLWSKKFDAEKNARDFVGMVKDI